MITLIAAAMLAAIQPATVASQSWDSGTVMWGGGYSDMPYMVALPDGDLVSTLTINDGAEGGAAQRVVVIHSTDKGHTWDAPVELEPADGPESSWAMPWLSSTGRLYVFYAYNVDDVRLVPNNDGVGGSARVDSVGVIAYKSSTDGGHTWSERGTLELPETSIDLRNPWGGGHRLFWLSGHPVERDGAVYLGVSKSGTVRWDSQFIDTEAFVLAVREGGAGVLAVDHLSSRISTAGAVNEEPSQIVFPDGTVNVVFRTTAGQLGEAWSTDDGATWTVDWAHDADGNIVPQPRAKGAQFLLPDGRIFLWGHNNSVVPNPGSFNGPRNPVFYRIGHRVGDRVAWGPARMLLSDPNPETRISYPSVVVVGDELLVAATDKATARIFRFPLDGL